MAGTAISRCGWCRTSTAQPRWSDCRPALRSVLALVPEGARERVEQRIHSASTVGLSLCGLEFARVQHGLAPGSFQRKDRITFGAGPSETELNDDTAPMLRDVDLASV